MRTWIQLLWPWLLAQALAAQPLTLTEVIQRTIQHHPKMRGVALVRQLAEAKVTEKEGAFDPSLVAASEYLRYQSPTAPGKAKLADDQLLGVQIQDVAGWKLMTGYRRNQGQTKAPDSLTGEGGEFFVEFKLPLLRGLNVNEKQTALEQARAGLSLAEALNKVVRLDTLLAASTAYWDWCAACTEWSLLQRNLRLAEVRAGQVSQRVAAGDLPRVNEIEAGQELQRRLEAVAKAERGVQKSVFKLALYLWNSDGEAASLPRPEQAVLTFPEEMMAALGPSACPVAEPAGLARGELQEAELQSLQQRPELSQIAFQREIVDLDRKLAENDRLPALDLTLGPGLDMGYQSIGLTYKVGLQLTVPLANRSADGRLRAARLKSDKLDLDQVLEIQRILNEVRDSASQLEASQNRLVPALESLRLALKLEEAERLKFRLGDSTLFLVNQRERNTVSEALKIVEIFRDGLKARAILEASAGRL